MGRFGPRQPLVDGEGIYTLSHRFVRGRESAAQTRQVQEEAGPSEFPSLLSGHISAGDIVTVPVDTVAGVSEPRLLALARGFVLELGLMGSWLASTMSRLLMGFSEEDGELGWQLRWDSGLIGMRCLRVWAGYGIILHGCFMPRRTGRLSRWGICGGGHVCRGCRDSCPVILSWAEFEPGAGD